MLRIVCATPSEFNALLAEAEERRCENQPLFLLFTGEKDRATGRSWCGDCTRAEPLIDAALANIAGGCVLLECIVVRQEYRERDYVYRTDPRIQLKCVPTLIKWRNGKALGSLDDNQCQNETYLNDLIEA